MKMFSKEKQSQQHRDREHGADDLLFHPRVMLEGRARGLSLSTYDVHCPGPGAMKLVGYKYADFPWVNFLTRKESHLHETRQKACVREEL